MRDATLAERPNRPRQHRQGRRYQAHFTVHRYLQVQGHRIIAVHQRSAHGRPHPARTRPHSATVENTPTPATSATRTSDRIEQIERLGERLAQRILVSDRSQVGDSEVRIQLRESVLQGGEIRLRQEHGQLVVSIQIPSTDLARQLSGQTDALQQTLANRLETSVRVEVQVVGARDAGNDANPGDGRSRNRRDPWETYEDQGA
jgi:type III secretion system needle length determinant